MHNAILNHKNNSIQSHINRLQEKNISICEELDKIDTRIEQIGKQIISLKADMKVYPDYRKEIIKQMKSLKERWDTLKAKRLYYDQLGHSLSTLEMNIIGKMDNNFEKVKEEWDRKRHIRGSITKRAMERRDWKRTLAGFVWDPSQKRYEHIQKLIMHASTEEEQRQWVKVGIEITKLKMDNK